MEKFEKSWFERCSDSIRDQKKEVEQRYGIRISQTSIQSIDKERGKSRRKSRLKGITDPYKGKDKGYSESNNPFPIGKGDLNPDSES